jgi:hypothetical protein
LRHRHADFTRIAENKFVGDVDGDTPLLWVSRDVPGNIDRHGVHPGSRLPPTAPHHLGLSAH